MNEAGLLKKAEAALKKVDRNRRRFEEQERQLENVYIKKAPKRIKLDIPGVDKAYLTALEESTNPEVRAAVEKAKQEVNRMHLYYEKNKFVNSQIIAFCDAVTNAVDVLKLRGEISCEEADRISRVANYTKIRQHIISKDWVYNAKCMDYWVVYPNLVNELNKILGNPEETPPLVFTTSIRSAESSFKAFTTAPPFSIIGYSTGHFLLNTFLYISFISSVIHFCAFLNSSGLPRILFNSFTKFGYTTQ